MIAPASVTERNPTRVGAFGQFLHLASTSNKLPMKQLPPLLVLSVLCLGYVHGSPTPVTSRVEAVTVFLNGAQVTRSAEITLPVGETQYRLEKLSPYVDAQSIRVRAVGELIIKSVFYQRNYLDTTQQSEESQALATRLEELRRQIAQQEAHLAVLEEEEALLIANRTLGGNNEAVTTVQLQAMADFFRTRLTELKDRQTELGFAIEDLKSQQARLQQQRNGLSAEPEEPSGEIIITVRAEKQETVNLEVSYTVAQAGWYPTYDVRVADVTSPVRLLYQANVQQQTGEDWNEVKLTFSNANPQQNSTRPTLNPWYLDFYQPNRMRGVAPLSNRGLSVGQVRGRVTDGTGSPIPGVNVLVQGTTVGTVTNLDGQYQLALPQNAQSLVFSSIGYASQEVPIYGAEINVTLEEDIQALSEVVVIGYGDALQGKVAGVEVVEEKTRQKPVPVSSVVQPTTVNFAVDIPYTIPSDGENYTVEMQDLSIPATYEYFTAPKVSKEVFLTALITDWEPYNLMAGEASIFFEDTFVGRSVLDVDRPNDTLTVSLGQDRGISVSRTRVADYSEKNFFGTTRSEQVGYEIALRSNKAQAVNIVVEDQVPVSTNEQIRVEVEETSKANYNEATGLLRWSLELSAAETRKLRLGYEVKYPKGKRVELD